MPDVPETPSPLSPPSGHPGERPAPPEGRWARLMRRWERLRAHPAVAYPLGFMQRGWAFVDRSRRFTVNFIFLVLVVVLLYATCAGDEVEVPDEAALVLAPEGALVEELAMDPSLPFTGGLLPTGPGKETLLRDVTFALDRAAEDDRIQVVVLHLDKFGGAGLSKLQEVGEALDEFREVSDKKVIAYANSYGQSAYYLASRADEVYMHPFGQLSLDGYGGYQTYYKRGLDRLAIEWNIFRVGTYKSAVEPYLQDHMSDAAREANLDWMGDLWDAYLVDVAAARELEVDSVRAFANDFDVKLRASGGDWAQSAVDAGLIDELLYPDELRAKLVGIVGEDEKKHTFHQIGHEAFVEHWRGRESRKPKKTPAVAVVIARGTIMNGVQPPGTIGGESTAKLIRKAREDENVEALVLRVDSPGGSVFGSEVIRRELEVARNEGLTVVVSMSSVAASGGYWISTASDEIWASPTTITGSIGIFGMFPTFEKPLEELLGVTVDGVSTAPLAGVTPERSLDPRVASALQLGIEHGYERFLERVAGAREMSRDDVDAIAQGRVWSGLDAKRIGLVDKLGGLDDAIASAAALADVEDDFRVAYVSKELTFNERLLKEVLDEAHVREQFRAQYPASAGPFAELQAILRDLAVDLSRFDDPHGIYAFAFVDVD